MADFNLPPNLPPNMPTPSGPGSVDTSPTVPGNTGLPAPPDQTDVDSFNAQTSVETPSPEQIEQAIAKSEERISELQQQLKDVQGQIADVKALPANDPNKVEMLVTLQQTESSIKNEIQTEKQNLALLKSLEFMDGSDPPPTLPQPGA